MASLLLRSSSSSSSAAASDKPRSELVDPTLHAFGFEFEELSPKKVTGRLQVTRICCQPFKVLHGGVSALISEALASVGAHLASGLQRVAGIQLSINHVKSAGLGDLVLAEAAPISVGRKIQVWEVKIFKYVGGGDGELGSKMLLSTSRVTLLCDMPVPEHAKDAGEHLKIYAKL